MKPELKLKRSLSYSKRDLAGKGANSIGFNRASV